MQMLNADMWSINRINVQHRTDDTIIFTMQST